MGTSMNTPSLLVTNRGAISWKRASLLVIVAPLIAFSCQANVTIGCEDGNCTTAASGGCVVPISRDADTHGYPPDVYGILQSNCFPCHQNPTKNGAPHSFIYYDDSQAIYGGTERYWHEMILELFPNPALASIDDQHTADGRKTPGMPNNAGVLPECQLDVMRQWLAACGGDDGSDTCKCPMGTGTFHQPDSIGGAGGQGMLFLDPNEPFCGGTGASTSTSGTTTSGSTVSSSTAAGG
jgi:hypothetical protein